MSKPTFVYVTYIRATREKVWQALTDGALTDKYWFRHRIEGEWKVGGLLRFYDGTGKLVHDDKVLACDPPSLLSYSWRSIRQEHLDWGTSRVTFTLEQIDDQVKLTMTHDEFAPDGRMLQAVSGGWPAVLSSLKSFLETGMALSETQRLRR